MFVDLSPGNLSEISTGRICSRDDVRVEIGFRINRLQQEGLQRGDRVFIFYGNCIEFFLDLLAVWQIGASLTPIDSRLSGFEIENLVRAVNPRVALTDDQQSPQILAALGSGGVKIVARAEATLSHAARGDRWPISSRAFLDDEALILFTSGSTGTPKGVTHTHRSLRARWLSLRQALGTAAYERTLCLLPTHFGHGLICNSLFPWLSGQELFIAPAFSADWLMQLGKLIDQHRITFLSSVPSMWSLTLKTSKAPQGGSLRRVHCGSAPLTGQLWKEIQNWARTKEVFNAYGITETGSWVAGTNVGDFTPEDGFIGVPWGAVIKVLRSRDSQAPFDPDTECKSGESGYVWVNTPALMQGYFGQQRLTDEVVCGGWFLTGDIGLCDDRGWLFLKGRERDEINKGGMKIYPADIDAVAARFEHTREVCAFGIADPLYGQNVAIAVVLADDRSETIVGLHDWMKQRLAEFKMPIRWYLLDAIPRTSRGKINRDALRESCLARKPLNLQSVLSSKS